MFTNDHPMTISRATSCEVWYFGAWLLSWGLLIANIQWYSFKPPMKPTLNTMMSPGLSPERLVKCNIHEFVDRNATSVEIPCFLFKYFMIFHDIPYFLHSRMIKAILITKQLLDKIFTQHGRNLVSTGPCTKSKGDSAYRQTVNLMTILIHGT